MAVGPIARVLPFQNPHVEEARGRYYGKYMGFVRDRQDPEKLGRIRAHVPSVMGVDNVAASWLDWALPASPGLSVPPVGAPVWIEFEGGFVTNPVYSWGWIRGDTTETSEAPVAGKGEQDATWVSQAPYVANGFVAQEIHSTIPADTAKTAPPVYPYNKVYQSEGGIIIEVDDSPNSQRVRLFHPGGGGTTLLIMPDGTVQTRTTTGAIKYEAGGDFVIALKPGSSFKVVYDQGGGLVVGPTGTIIAGPQVSVMGRAVNRSGGAI